MHDRYRFQLKFTSQRSAIQKSHSVSVPVLHTMSKAHACPLVVIFILQIITAYSACSFNITAIAETPKRFNNHDLNAADCDDTAIIINQHNKSQSFIVGTLKQAGLELYYLNGQLLQSILAPNSPTTQQMHQADSTRFNNVAVIQSTTNQSKSIIIVTDRGSDQLRFYTLNAEGLLEDVTNASIPWLFSTSQSIVNKQETAYGLTATNFNNSMIAFVSQRHQNFIAKVKILEIDQFYSYQVVDVLTLPIEFENGWTPCTESDDERPQIEGMVVASNDGTLLISQEVVGLYRTVITGNDYNFSLIDTVCTVFF